MSSCSADGAASDPWLKAHGIAGSPYAGERQPPRGGIESLYDKYNFVAAFAMASLLTLLALITLRRRRCEMCFGEALAVSPWSVFPASGSSWKSFAREGVTMDDPATGRGCRFRSAVNRLQRSRLPRSRRDSHFCQILST
jgi:hypothetical protein